MFAGFAVWLLDCLVCWLFGSVCLVLWLLLFELLWLVCVLFVGLVYC